MQEYQNKDATLYKQFPIRVFSLNPVIEDLIAKYAKAGAKLLDVACGYGYFYAPAVSNGYTYTGIDLSKPLLEKAKSIHPEGNFLLADATNFSSTFTSKFDLILNIMLVPVFKTKEDFEHNISECKKVLAEGSKLIVASAHPCFDSYMQYGQGTRQDVVTDYSGYFTSPKPYTVIKDTEGGKFEFHDAHWTLQDYFAVFNKCGLQVTGLIEPDVKEEMEKTDPDLYKTKKNFPTFIVFELS